MCNRCRGRSSPVATWGNPFKVGMLGVPDRPAAVAMFERAVQLNEPCHADVLLWIANGSTGDG
jgi:hypothetical protein